MRRIAFINQKGGVGKTTSTVNLGAALARLGRRVVIVDLDPQANLSLHLDVQVKSGEASTYAVLLGNTPFAAALLDTRTSGLRLLPSSIDLSGAELELANSFGREMILRDALDTWENEYRAKHHEAPADYVLLDCPPSLGLLAVNGLVAAQEAVIAVQTEFFALQGMTKLVEIVQLLRRRLNPRLDITGFLPCLYDNRTRLAREVIAELRAHFPGRVYTRAIAKNVKLAEAPSYGKTIFEYAPESSGANDYELVAREVIAQESRDAELFARFPGGVVTEFAAPAPKVRTAASQRAPRPSTEVTRSADPAVAEFTPHVAAATRERASEATPTVNDHTPALRSVELKPAMPPLDRAPDRAPTQNAGATARGFEPLAIAVLAMHSEQAREASPSLTHTAVALDELPELPADSILLDGSADG